MDQALFEQALAPFAIKKVDKDNGLVSFEVTATSRKKLLSTDPKALEAHRAKQEAMRKRITAPKAATVDYNKLRAETKPRKRRRVHTPEGWFDSAIDAAEFFDITMPQLYARMQQSKITKKGSKEWYYEGQERE